MKSNAARLLTTFAPLVVGIIAIVLGILFLANPHDNYKETTAVISEIEEYYDTVDETYKHNTFIDYEVDGVKYTHVEFGAYDSSYVEGKEITIKYNPDNPSQIESGNRTVGGIIFLVLGVLFVGFSVFKILRKGI